MSKNQKEIKVKKVDKNGKPLQGVEFKLYLDSTIDSYDREYSTSLTDKDGMATFKVEEFYYGGYIKETKTLNKYVLRNDEKDIIRFYKDNGVRFIGERKVSDFKVSEAKEGQDLNKYLQSLIENDTNRENGYYDGPKDINGQIAWLIFNDNGTEKLIPKSPLKYNISWNNINDADLVYGNKNINVDEKTYKIRLINDTNKEWNHMMLPLTGIDGKEKNNSSAFGRFGWNTTKYVEKNMPSIANYTWLRDLGGLSNYCWTQDTRFSLGPKSKIRGSRDNSSGMAYSFYAHPNAYTHYSSSYSWRPVLEEVK